ncbi:exocyst complex component 2 isoform X2 [Lingula anatina]|uniref:Exocyst complex component 2 n=1 Tax=Lingula anatina TaxID=7574 RepID=A0A1S3J0M6_LINAN|nr:exocyst complex component 2 isoform X2 [Lingula anatina]|eukprot:XP_013403813.1 exocyst complex component 2 isoform X2 [Lingula anatina]
MSVEPPLVTGISPKEGPPGTRVTIRGENLGAEPKDLIGLKICGVDCYLSAEWKSPNKIIARTGPGKGKGDIVVTTKSAGTGTCTVGFRGYFVQTGPLQESAIWIDESQTLDRLGRGRASSPVVSRDFENPLGLSDEGNQGKYAEDILLEIFPEGSGDTKLENFDSAWFLLENHHGAGFDDLKAGLQYLKRNSGRQKEGPLAFVKTNLSTFMDCQETMRTMHEELIRDIQANDGSSITYQLENLLRDANKTADSLFQDVLGRKDRADSTRNALSVLQRFKFLFNLPCNMEKNIKKGDYDMVINDYGRVRSLFKDTDIAVFKKVYEEVERRVADFREMLHKKLLELPSTLDEQKKLVRYLVELESAGDPAWECLSNQQQWLLQLLTDCKTGHMDTDKSFMLPQVETEAPPTPSQRIAVPGFSLTSGFKTGKNHSFSSTQSPEQAGWKFKTPQRVLFVEELTDILTESFPDFWKLGQAYFSGNLILRETERIQKIDTSKHVEFKKMASDVIQLFSNLMRAAFLPESLENIDPALRKTFGEWSESKHDTRGAWLPHCVRYIRSCVGALSNLDLPEECLNICQELAFDMRTHCMVTLLKQAIQDMKNLHQRESWNVDTDDVCGGITQLPLLFENIVNETIQHLHEVVMKLKPGETNLFDQRDVQIEATALCTQLVKEFSNCIEKLAFKGDTLKPKKQTQSSSVSAEEETQEEKVPAYDKRLLIMLSNCNHTIQRAIPRITENMDKHQYPETEKIAQEAISAFQEVDEKLFEAYVEEKSNPIIGALEQNMYAGRFNWDECLKPVGVRSYLKEALMGLIRVHAEVFAISPVLVTRILTRVIVAVSEEVARLILCVETFNLNGALQARLELITLQDAVALYATDESSEAVQEALDYLPELKSEDKRFLEDLINNFKTRMKFQLMCFKSDPVLRGPAA